MGKDRLISTAAALAVGLSGVLYKAEPTINTSVAVSNPTHTATCEIVGSKEICVPPGYYLCQNPDGSPLFCAIQSIAPHDARRQTKDN